jgi:predicted MFS family arabinose efflux permease
MSVTVSVQAAKSDPGWRQDFRWRWAAQAFSEFGSAVAYSALPLVAIIVLGASEFQVSLLTVVSSVVSAALALPVGPWIEYHRKRPVMIGADLLRFVAIGSVAVATYFSGLTYWHLCLVAVAGMAATLTFASASTADLKALVPPAHRAGANSRFETTLWTANTIGPPTGTALITWLGPAASLVVDAFSYLISAVALRRRRTPEPEPPRRATEHHWRRDIVAGWRHIFAHRGLTALFWNSLIFGGCILAASPLITYFMVHDRGFPLWQFGLVFGVAGVAGVIGSLLVKPALGRFGQRRVLLATGVGRNLWLILIPLAGTGTGGLVLIAASEILLLLFVGLFNPTFATYRMNAADDRYLARVTLAWSISSKTAQPLFILAAGLLAFATSAQTALIVLSVILLAATALLPWRSAQ